MTGLTETEHLVAALAAGGVDYVTKPIKPREVMARAWACICRARAARQQAQQAGQARNALDAFGYASMTVHIVSKDEAMDGMFDLANATGAGPAQALLRHLRPGDSAARPELAAAPSGRCRAPDRAAPPVGRVGCWCLTFRLHQRTDDAADSGGGGVDWLIVMREISEEAVVEAMSLSFKLTAPEAEVLYWVVKGKINRDIADIVGASPATVKKHLERVYAKLGVETRTAAAGHSHEPHPAAASAV